jgi:hypothetical protein
MYIFHIPFYLFISAFLQVAISFLLSFSVYLSNTPLSKSVISHYPLFLLPLAIISIISATGVGLVVLLRREGGGWGWRREGSGPLESGLALPRPSQGKCFLTHCKQ